MNNAHAKKLMETMARRGYRLSLRDSRLRVHGKKAMPPDLIKEIKKNKSAIIAVLSASRSPEDKTLAGLPPHHTDVTCSSCWHFKPDTINPAEGLGHCTVDAWRPGRLAPWPNAKRRCDSYLRLPDEIRHGLITRQEVEALIEGFSPEQPLLLRMQKDPRWLKHIASTAIDWRAKQ